MSFERILSLNTLIKENFSRYGIPSDKAVWDRMLEKYVSETNAQEKSKLLRGLASVKDPWLLYRLIEVGHIGHRLNS